MRHIDVKKPLNLVYVICLSILLSLGVYGQVLADSEPYFITGGADDFAGGWYAVGNTCATAGANNTAGGNYQTPNYSQLSSTKYAGSILGFARVGGINRAGASSQLGAFSLGVMEGPTGSAVPQSSDFGFYTGNSGNNALSFANTGLAASGTTAWGGLLDGANTRREHCIPDYYNTKKQGTPANWVNNNSFNSASGQYQYTGTLDLGGPAGGITPVSATEGRKITLFVRGTVNITSDITYAGYTADNIPKFALVVLGNINIAPNVRNLNGWYIAQPANPASASTVTDNTTGVIWTCHDNTTSQTPPRDIWVRSNCLDKQLIVNGALTAKQTNFNRVTSGNGIANGPAEVVNYTPDMVMGGPFFNAPPPTGKGIQSLISLPPVF